MRYFALLINGQSYPVGPDGLRIGSGPINHVVLSDPQVSPYHAVLWVQSDQLYIRDQNSATGTWVNRQRITGTHALRAGDRIRIGNAELQVITLAVGPDMPKPVAGPAPQPPVTPSAKTVVIPLQRPTTPPAPGSAARRRPRWLFIAIGILGPILCILALVGLAPTLRSALAPPSPTPTATSTPTPTRTPTPTSTPTRTPTPTPRPTHTPTPTPCLPDAAFVTDVTVPDGTQFRPGASFTKTWRVRSSGCTPWPRGTQWVFVSGDRMGAPAAVDVPLVAAGATADIAVPMTAPNTPGTYKGYWQMRDPNGRFFGDRVYVMIVVAQPTPTPDTRPTVSVTIINDTGGTLTLSLSGPATYRFTLGPGRHTIRVIPGDYSYTVWGCGGASKSGTQSLSEGDEWRFWCQ